MVKTLLQLKLHLVAASLKRSTARLVIWILVMAYCAFVIAMLLIGLLFARQAAASHLDVTRTATVMAGSVLTLGWILIPLLAFGADQTLDPARFALFPVTGRRLAPGLTLASLLGGPGLLTTLAAVGGALAVYSAGLAPALLAGLGAATGVVLAALCCRVGITFMSTSLASRRGRDLASLITVVLFVGGYVAYVGAASRLGEGAGSTWERMADRAHGVAAVLEWTPLGAPWAWGADAAQGQWLLLAGHIAAALAYLVLGLACFGKLLNRALHDPAPVRSEGPAAKDDGIARWCRRLPRALGGQAAAVSARCLLYYRRDPRYTALLPLILMLPIICVVLNRATSGGGGAFGAGSDFGWAGTSLAVVGCGMMAFMAGYTLSNDTASDATAWWLHLASGVSGRADRTGRVVAEATWCVPLLVVAGVAIPLVVDRPDKVLVSVGTMLGLYGASLGVSMVASAMVVYPTALPGESPFSTKTAQLSTQLAAQMGSSLVALLVATPLIVLAFLAPAGLAWLVLVTGVLWGVGGVVGGVAWGGQVMDRRGPEILDSLRQNDSRARV
ncbi:MAG: hypothetical protein LBR19_00910 [Bifidobacteriaceae bacterium]|nr:hypothetical protein [Bifidobacteriaceae bacterium]